MKALLLVFLLLTAGRAQAQFLSLKQLLLLAEKEQGNFQGEGPHPAEVERVLRGAGFARVRWRENDPDLEGNPASYKLYSRSTDAFLIFCADAHGRLLEEIIYRFHSPACVVSLRKQLVAAGFKGGGAAPPPAADGGLSAPLFYHFASAQYGAQMEGKADAEGNDLHRYTFSIRREAAMQQMMDELYGVNEVVPQAVSAETRPKPHSRKSASPVRP